MKLLTLLLPLLAFSYGYTQSLPVDFEGNVTTSDFTDFEGGNAEVIANPFRTGINTSNTVARIIRSEGEIWAGSKIALSSNLDFSQLTKITMKVYTTAPVGTTVKFKLEGSGPAVEVDAFTGTSGTWETMEWIFAGTPNNLNELVFMFDFGNLGDSTASSTFYFDDIEQVQGPPAPVPTSLPIDFETGVVSSDFLDFSGGTASVISNPQQSGSNTSSMVGQIVRNNGYKWAGSKILLTENLDLSTQWHISMKVYTDAPVGTRVKLQLEGPASATTLDVLTTATGEWETLDWNFDGQPNDFNRVSFMFDFGKVGDGSATSTFLFDDVQQLVGPAIPDPNPTSFPIDFEENIVSTDFISEFGAIATVIPNPHKTGINSSETVAQFIRSGGQAWARSKIILTDFIDYTTLSSITMMVYTEAPVGTLLKLKVESTEAAYANERDVRTTASGEWARYSWDFAGDPPVYNVVTIMFAYGPIGDASPNSTFLIDNIEQALPPPPTPTTSLPIDFESSVGTNHFLNFDGAIGTVILNSQKNDMNPSDSIGQIIRNGGKTWAGSKVLLEDSLDFSEKGYLSMKVYTNAPIGTPVKLKLEGEEKEETEADALTTVSGEWETLTWDFTDEPTKFHTLVLMFDFGTQGDGSIASTFLFDDIIQTDDDGTTIVNPVLQAKTEEQVLYFFPNPVDDFTTLNFRSKGLPISLEIIDMNGRLVRVLVEKKFQEGNQELIVDLRNLPPGTYMYRMAEGATTITRKLIKK